ncbi:MAG: hemerythrin domain-containing protein [Desulfatiglandales bacterium]
MEEYLNKGIKEIINQFPEVENILNEYDIGCAPCSIGSCLLKDIIDIHNLSSEAERGLMAKIAKVIYPDRETEIPSIKRKPKASPKGISYSPPMEKLVNEHVLIKRWVAMIPEVINNLDVESEQGRQVISDSIDFIRSYADKYHHAKEEEILFKYFDENLDIIKTMQEDHENARARVRAMLKALAKKDKEAISKHLNSYQELLTEHIKKEDEILYPWMDRNFSITQIGELFSKFNEKDEEFGDVPKRCEEFINKLEEKFKLTEVIK